MKHLRFYLYCIVALVLVGLVKSDLSENEIKECFDKDSISCIQMQLFRNARELMNQDSIPLLTGMSLVRDKSLEGRSGKSMDTLEMESKVENATDILARQDAIENFLIRKARDVVIERTIRWDVGETIRNILNSVPEAIRTKFSNYVVEARGKSKKILRILAPLLIGLKLKMVGLAGLAYLAIALFAKKALLASLISLLVSGFIGLKKLLGNKYQTHNDVQVAPYPMAWAPAPGYDNHGDYSQKMAYNAHMSS